MMKKAMVKIKAGEEIGCISPLLYGHFAEQIGGVIYGGVWVGKDSSIPNVNGIRLDLVEKLKRIAPPVIRWPGGCFAECYDWRDGVGKDRPTRPSWWTREDGRYEENAFGTHEFIELCRLVGAEPYLAINVTSQTPLDARNWIDYCNSPRGMTTLAREREKNGAAESFAVQYIGVGNENWGGGGTMCAEQYAFEYRKYAAVLRNIAPHAKLVANASNQFDERWTKTFLENIKESYRTPVQPDAISTHYYFTDEKDVDFGEDGWNKLIESVNGLDAHLRERIALLKEYGRLGKIKLYLDEWGAMYQSGVGAKEKNQLFRQQVTQRDAVAVALTFHILHRHCSVVEMANVAQLVNCLSSLFLTQGEKCIETPVYHVFEMFCAHQGAQAVSVDVNDEKISASASRKEDKLLLTLANLSFSEDKEISLDGCPATKAAMLLLAPPSPMDYNDFDMPDRVQPIRITRATDKPIVLPKGAIMAISIPLEEKELQ